MLEIVQWLHSHMIILMMAIFVVIAVAAYWPGSRSRFEESGRIPLRDDG
jgi:cbb3-type cytochrome oxidase subunit 3